MNSAMPSKNELSVPSEQLREAIAQLMRCAAERQFKQARYFLEWIFDCRGRLPSMAALKEIASGALPIEQVGSFYAPAGSALPPVLVSQLQDAISQCSAFLALPAPTLLVECSASREQLHLTFENFPGFAIVRFSSADPHYPGEIRRVVIHEVAHAFLTCGVRLLDEGFATFVASQLAGEPLEEVLVPHYSLAALLSPAANSALAFEAVVGNAREGAAAYAYGARIIARVHCAGGINAVRRLLRDAQFACDDGELLALVHAAGGDDSATSRVPTADGSTSLPHSRQIRQLIFDAYDTQDPTVLAPAIADLESQLRGGDFATLDDLLCARLAAANLAHALGALPRGDVERIDLLVAEAAGRLSTERLWAIRGHRGLLALKVDRNNILKVATAYRRAVFAYERALELCPTDSDAVFGRALLYLYTPKRHGGDREAGLRLLRSLLADEVYAEHVSRLIESTESEDDVQAHVAKAPFRLSGTQLAAVRARDVALRLSDAFRLELGGFEVGTTERVAIIGANGSGKTVLVECLLGLRSVDAGEIDVLGRPVGEGLDVQRKRHLGALLQMSTLPAAMYVHEIVRLHDGLYGPSSPEVAKALGISELRAMQFKNLSRGQARRVQLFVALGHSPQLAVLDEPTLGVDEHYASSLRRLWRDSLRALLIVSHSPGELEVVDRVVWLEDGRVRDQGPLAELVQNHVGSVKCQILEQHDKRQWGVESLAGVKSVRRDAQGRLVIFGTSRLAAEFPGFLFARGIQAFSMERASTSDLLSVITGEGEA